MPDDDRPKRRHQSQADRDLDAIKRRSTPAGGVHTFLDNNPFDDEHTPTPVTLDEMTLEQSEQAEALRQLREASNKNAAAIEHEQKARREGREIGRLQAKMAALAGITQQVVEVGTVLEESVRPALRDLAGDVKALLREREVDRAFYNEIRRHLELVERELGRVDERLKGMETSISRMDTDAKLLAQRVDNETGSLHEQIGEMRSQVNGLTSRLAALEVDGKVQVALTTREKATLGGGAASVGAAVAWLLQHFLG